MAAKQKQARLEDALTTLESLVERMESGELSLEESLKAFEEGVRLTRECQQALKQAEQKVSILLDQSQDAEPAPFNPPDNDDAGSH
ncbi:exodeoxyribonuclease VII small subunit [Alcanivorax sp. JB21]|uniref:exodeoxyribonuclease VII small subunit n=1 Tax=Alcanivorax limicola TaxID=2874102 RepID=UPI001CBDCB57|nr:exodeoxyribonuclease VII small subunit [Alcanivorax limicola]MBZ2190199.1 exodeoxyribonuclease VII small subunit [Alcanivorax limicola]